MSKVASFVDDRQLSAVRQTLETRSRGYEMETTEAEHKSHPPKYVFLGVPMTILLSGEQTGGQFTLIEGTMPPGGDGGLHVHRREDEAMHLLEGELDVTIGGKALRLRSGESYFARRGVPHRLRNRGNIPARSLAIHTPAGFDEFVRQAGIPLGDWNSGASASPDQLRKIVESAALFGVELLKAPGPD